MPARPSPAAALERALATRRILVVCGSGGVGKTTTAAALALRAARSGRRVLVCTIDPSRRLATSLGLNQLSGKPRAIDLRRLSPPPARGGALCAMVLDMKSTFDALVDAPHAPTRRPASASSATASTGTSRPPSPAATSTWRWRSCSSSRADERCDLVVLDTPPTRHALDFLEAPDRLMSFLDTSILRWFLQPLLRRRPPDPEGRDPHRGHRPPPGRPLPRPAVPPGPLGVLPGLREHVRWVQGARARRSTRCCATPPRASCWWRARRALALEEALYFHRRLTEKGMPFVAFVVNRVHTDPAARASAPPRRGSPPRRPRARRRGSPRRCASSRCWPAPSGGRWPGSRWTRASGPARARARAGHPRPARPRRGRRARLRRRRPRGRARGGRLVSARLILYSGKGGVGKTSLSAATAIRAAQARPPHPRRLDRLGPQPGRRPRPARWAPSPRPIAARTSTRWRSTSTRSWRATGARSTSTSPGS